MNAPEPFSLPDIQAQADDRNLAIDAVGVKGVRYPVTIRSGGDCVPTIGTFSMTVGLPADAKGTHMSRFVELLEARTEAVDAAGFEQMVRDMLRRLDAREGAVEMAFTHFARKTAPVSRVQSLLDYEAMWRGTIDGTGYRLQARVEIPVTSLCPCSKEISRYGAHNQRSHIEIQADFHSPVEIAELIAIAEGSASCEIFGLLKRADEKYVTERAYENPKFVEDLVRDVAAALQKDARIASFVVEAENFESIHNHSAFARIAGRPRAQGKVVGVRDRTRARVPLPDAAA
ncbi:MAG: GTP cyclohydrolase FolE2 [Armatimonadota bacterium]